ncbi:MAG TPA: DUF3570 domain-containing protein [Steroidobacteraceae bacterium]|nr:DUF3570 domain-containing protein [Steroidobacteraceae bacterium]
MQLRQRSDVPLLRLGLWAKVLAALCLVGTPASADVLPDDRADVLYHNYDGGGITIQGPSVLIRKKVGDNFSFSANYYEDLISSASIDVKLSASPYHETRKQEGFSVDYLHGKTIYTAGYIHSREPDYKADTSYFAVSQSMFGDLTTITMGYRRGWDQVYRDECNPALPAHPAGTECPDIINDPNFHQQADHRAYSVSVSQILTRNAIFDFNFEGITDQGYLASPYRQILYVDHTNPLGYTLANQVYPGTRTSTASSGELKYYLPYRAAVTGMYRYYNDTWGINGHTLEVDYTQPAFGHWILDGSIRYYRQNAASFYSDLFPRADYQNFMARDRELAAFHSLTLGFGASYEFHVPYAPWINKSSLNFHYNRLMIDYSDFRNAIYTKNDPTLYPIGTEPLYRLEANIFQLFVSIWF